MLGAVFRRKKLENKQDSSVKSGCLNGRKIVKYAMGVIARIMINVFIVGVSSKIAPNYSLGDTQFFTTLFN
jgi:hypothetical protein